MWICIIKLNLSIEYTSIFYEERHVYILIEKTTLFKAGNIHMYKWMDLNIVYSMYIIHNHNHFNSTLSICERMSTNSLFDDIIYYYKIYIIVKFIRCISKLFSWSRCISILVRYCTLSLFNFICIIHIYSLIDNNNTRLK